MTRKAWAISLVVLSVFFLLVRPEILGGIFALFFLGMIPGTTFSLPSWLMLLMYGIGAIIVIHWLARQPMYVGNMARQEKTARALARKKVLASKKKTASRKTTRRVKRAQA